METPIGGPAKIATPGSRLACPASVYVGNTNPLFPRLCGEVCVPAQPLSPPFPFTPSIQICVANFGSREENKCFPVQTGVPCDASHEQTYLAPQAEMLHFPWGNKGERVAPDCTWPTWPGCMWKAGSCQLTIERWNLQDLNRKGETRDWNAVSSSRKR
jgi:hypothetical protein